MKTTLTDRAVMTAYTPGPWAWEMHQPASDGAQVYAVADGLNFGCRYLKPADARLIAAAPDMLAALRAVLSHLHIALNQAEDSGILNAMDAARTAIAKATVTGDE